MNRQVRRQLTSVLYLEPADAFRHVARANPHMDRRALGELVRSTYEQRPNYGPEHFAQLRAAVDGL